MKSAFALSAAIAACLATPVSAQKKPSLDGEKIVAHFAKCAVRAAPHHAENILDTVPGSEDEKAQLDLLLQKQAGCMDFGPSVQGRQLAAEISLGRTTVTQAAAQLAAQRRELVFPSRALRGAIAEQLYLGSIDMKSPHSEVAQTSSAPAGYAVVRCAAEHDPVSADRLVHASRLSSAESDAARAFGPALTACAHGMGRVDISGTGIHGWAAEALYKQRRATATKEL